MSAKSLDSLAVSEPAKEYDTSLRIDRIKLTNYKFFHGEFLLPFNGENVLIYGENGSGKSSIYKAFELLKAKEFKNFGINRNIFSESGDVEVEFGFNNGTEFTLTEDTEEIPEHADFLKGLSVFAPMLDYKKLLKVHYSPDVNGNQINLYLMFRQLLWDYPVKKDTVLSGIKDVSKYFSVLEEIIDKKLLINTNLFLEKYFNSDFRIASFDYRQELIDDARCLAEPIVNLVIDYRDIQIDKYHTFLNEAKLSALAVSLYFAAIKELFGTLETASLKILVLDDLLINLDMNNCLKLLMLLKNEFSEFQLFFFTHDKELFELYKDKMSWKKYELFLDDSEEIPNAIVKRGKSETERAKEFFAIKEYDCCALLLRKGFEKLLKSYLSPKERLNRNYEELDLAAMIDKAIGKSPEESRKVLEKLNSDRKHILNPLSHYDARNIYSDELKDAMSDLEKLEWLLK